MLLFQENLITNNNKRAVSSILRLSKETPFTILYQYIEFLKNQDKSGKVTIM